MPSRSESTSQYFYLNEDFQNMKNTSVEVRQNILFILLFLVPDTCMLSSFYFLRLLAGFFKVLFYGLRSLRPT